jgi:hypothetical protein
MFRWMTNRLTIDRRWLALMIGAVAVLGLGTYGALPGVSEATLYLLPALLLLAVLAARRYPGERALLAMMRQQRPCSRWIHADEIARQSRPRALVPRGGALIAFALAVRPPPLAAAAIK